MENKEVRNESASQFCSGESCRLGTITPLAKQINCLDVKRIAYWMNHYPRRQLGYRSPSQMSTLKVA